MHSESINSSLGAACLDSSIDSSAFPGCGFFLAAVLSIYKHIYWVLWAVGKVSRVKQLCARFRKKQISCLTISKSYPSGWKAVLSNLIHQLHEHWRDFLQLSSDRLIEIMLSVCILRAAPFLWQMEDGFKHLDTWGLCKQQEVLAEFLQSWTRCSCFPPREMAAQWSSEWISGSRWQGCCLSTGCDRTEP